MRRYGKKLEGQDMITDTIFTKEEGENFSSVLERELREMDLEKYGEYFVNDISYFCWDDTPAYFVFLRSEESRKKCKEIVVSEVWIGDLGRTPAKWDFATHGFPCISNEVWKNEEGWEE